jgi:DNA-binding CsgD family transcriptional regulator
MLTRGSLAQTTFAEDVSMFETKASPGDADAVAVEHLALAWLSTDSIMRILVDDGLRVLWANEAAGRCFWSKSDLEVREGCLVTCNPAYQAALAAYVLSGGAEPETLCIPCAGGENHLLFRGRLVGADMGRRVLGLTVHHTGSRASMSYAGLRSAFNLTAGEFRVLDRMLAGRTADEVSAEFELSVETIRTHIRNIYTKIGVTSREALFARLNSYRS